MSSVNFNSNASLRTIKDRVEEALCGIGVRILDADGRPAAADATASDVQRTSPAPGAFKMPSFKAHVGTFEESFLDHFGIEVDLLLPDGSTAPNDKSLKWVCDIHQRDQTESPFARWLQESLAQHQMTQADLAEQTGLAPVTIDNLYNGYTLTPRRETQRSIETVLGDIPAKVRTDLEADQLLGGIGRFSDAELAFQSADGRVDLSDVPDKPGVYILYSANGSIVYVGMSGSSILTRIRSHSEKKWFIPPFVTKMAYVEIPKRETSRAVEDLLIKVLGRRNLLVNKQGMHDFFEDDEAG